MGDSGQLAPFSPVSNANQWRDLDHDPVQSAVDVLLRHHPSTHVERLPVTRRLSPSAARVAKSIYPGHEFKAAVLPGVRALVLDSGPGDDIDEVLEHAAATGWAHLELPVSAVLRSDPRACSCIVDIVARLLERTPTVQRERKREPTPLEPGDIAIAVTHNEQKYALQRALDDAGLSGITVNAANKLQGLTFEVVVACDPLAGLADADPIPPRCGARGSWNCSPVPTLFQVCSWRGSRSRRVR